MNFIKIDENNEIVLNEDVLKLFKNEWSGKKVIPVSIIGRSRIGKSSFLNLLIHGLKYGFNDENKIVEENFKAEYNELGKSVTNGIDIFPKLIKIRF